MKRNSLLLFFCLFVFVSNAQVSQDTVTATTINSTPLHRPSLSIKYSPFALISWTPGFLFSAEHSIGKNISIEYEAAFLDDLGYEARDFIGYQLGLGLRFYRDKRFGYKKNRFFMPLIRWKQTFTSGTGNFERYNAAYTQILDYRIENSTISLLLTLGRTFQLNDKLTIEYSYGLGLRNLKIILDEVPSDATFIDNDDSAIVLDLDPGEYLLPAAIINIKVGYILK